MSDIDREDPIVEARRALEQKDILAAIEACERVLAIDPQSLDGLFLLGLAGSATDPIRGLKVLEVAHEVHPNCREVVLMLARLNATLGRLADATYFAKLSLTLDEDRLLTALLPADVRDPSTTLANANVSRHFVDASIRFELRDYAAVVPLSEAALMVAPHDPARFNLLGRALVKLGLFDRGIAALRAAIHLAPGNASYRADLAEALILTGAFDDGRALLANATEDGDAELAARLPHLARLDPRATGDSLRQDTARWNERFAGAPEEVARQERPRHGGKVNVAYLINQDAIDQWLPAIESLLAGHNKSRFNIHVLQQYSHDEQATVRLRKHATSWREIHNVDDETLAFMLEQLGLDILVDLCGFSPNNRRPLLTRHIVPYQLGWLAYGPETREGAVDYVISDTVGEELFGDDRLVVTHGGMLRHSTVPATAEASLPAARNGYVTFGAEALPHRVIPSVPLWSRVLCALPDSVLLLGSKDGIDENVATQLAERFANYGLANRVRFQETKGRPTGFSDFLSEIDVLLDSHPVNGGLSTCIALREGVPVVSHLGNTSMGTIGASILTTAGHPEWIARDAAEFAAIAAELVADIDGLAETRKRLREQIPQSTLADGASLAASLEATFDGLLAQR